ncbi:hypothetical protein F4810DRAFT_668695 [Camillea tinctor]|nr:hypothetical protein F4810DRAFT_668695 [Camillea tinctor]
MYGCMYVRKLLDLRMFKKPDHRHTFFFPSSDFLSSKVIVCYSFPFFFFFFLFLIPSPIFPSSIFASPKSPPFFLYLYPLILSSPNTFLFYCFFFVSLPHASESVFFVLFFF